MTSAAPLIPSELIAKRKREDEDGEISTMAPATGPTTIPLDPASSHPSPSADKRRRVIGPTLPPGFPGHQDAPDPADPKKDEESSSSGDDGVGPALPTAQNRADGIVAEKKALQREEWMLVPPKQDDWSARVDPTKLRNRKFNTGRGAKAPAQSTGEESSLWTETPEQKRQRLAEEVMGIRKLATDVTTKGTETRNSAADEATAQRIQEYNVCSARHQAAGKTDPLTSIFQDKHRHQSLYHAHKKTVRPDVEDDPSKRAFDKEKDIGGGRTVGHTQRKELLRRAADFSSRFAGGSFL
ncbi:MAG: hypothetical protein M1826_001956 [Phylliscum demangeonii]|nr:MAG: hypothetical protein M1826_001956 [Phylliscum demangeonii]